MLPQAILMRYPAGTTSPVPPPLTPVPGRHPRATGGRPYLPPPRLPRDNLPKARVFAIDPDVLDRGTIAHKKIQDKLADAARARGLKPLSPRLGDPQFDVAWLDGDVAYIVEVKSLTDENEERRLRLGLGQVLSYVHLLDWPKAQEIRAVLAVERKPAAAYRIDLCSDHNVYLVWPARFGRLF
jgi:hypothetical protein